jgi:hypothetical protein
MSLGNLNGSPPRHPPIVGSNPAAAAILDDLVSNATRPGSNRDAESPIRFIDSATFARAEYPLRWLVDGLLVQGQPAIVGGPQKSLKTSLMLDLALSLGSRGQAPFLGHFRTVDRFRVGVMSGESGEATLQETARRIARDKGIRLEEAEVHWCFTLPRLSNDTDMQDLTQVLRDQGTEVVILDPLYLFLLGGGHDPGSASNLYTMGPLLRDVGSACLEAGATPILVHHTRKYREASARNKPLELEDLAFAGVQEYARQWMLVNRRAAYEPGTGMHQLWLGSGGSAGQSGLWAVDIDEGQLRDDFGGRHWRVEVKSPAEGRAAAANVRTQVRTQERDADWRNRVVSYLVENPGGETISCLADVVGTNTTTLRPLLDQMVQTGEIVAVSDVLKDRRRYNGYRCSGPAEPQ